MLLELFGIIIFVVFAAMLLIAWRDFKTGSGKLPEAFIRARKTGAIDDSLLKAFNPTCYLTIIRFCIPVGWV
jgi:hypothetical protein